MGKRVLFWNAISSPASRSTEVFTERAPGKVATMGADASSSKSASQPICVTKSGASLPWMPQAQLPPAPELPSPPSPQARPAPSASRLAARGDAAHRRDDAFTGAADSEVSRVRKEMIMGLRLSRATRGRHRD
jgi:hypothetical protein